MSVHIGLAYFCQVATGNSSGSFVTGSGTAVVNDTTFNGYTIGQVVTALQDYGLLA